jgi:(S)-citramalyl-CoA lyase
MHEQIRSALFVPATRPERFLKALGAGADVVIIDLEDAVERASKDLARRTLTEFAQGNSDVSFLVRVNDATTPWFESDLAVCGRFANIVGVLLPKAESTEQIRQAFVAGKPVFPIIESAKGVLVLDSIAASEGVGRLSFGSLDLMLDLGMAPDTSGAELLLNQVRCQILLHSKACGLAAPLDGVYPNFADQAGLAGIARQVCDMGFGGMLCIHPTQISTIHKAFAPTSADVEWARRVLDTAEATNSSAFKMDGKMVDVPVIERARRIIEKSNL